VLVQDKVWPTLLANWCIWPLAHGLNFYFVPTEQRILYNNFVAVCWTTWLSFLAHWSFGHSSPVDVRIAVLAAPRFRNEVVTVLPCISLHQRESRGGRDVNWSCSGDGCCAMAVRGEQHAVPKGSVSLQKESVTASSVSGTASSACVAAMGAFDCFNKFSMFRVSSSTCCCHWSVTWSVAPV